MNVQTPKDYAMDDLTERELYELIDMIDRTTVIPDADRAEMRAKLRAKLRGLGG